MEGIIDRNNRLIFIKYSPPPIPTDNFNWHVWYDGEEERGSIFFGKTKEEALRNLCESEED